MSGSNAQACEVRFAQNGAARIEYRVEGRGIPLMLIASTARGTEEFGQIAAALAAKGYRVLRPEPRGIGGSTGPMAGVTFHDFADDFAAVLRQEGGGPAILAGHAYGNWIARVIATDYPELARGVALVAAGALQIDPALSLAIARINDPETPEAQRLADLRYAFFAEGNDPRPWLAGWHGDVLVSQRAASRATPREEWWSAGTAPILDLLAEHDPFRPADTREETRNALGARVTVRMIAGASHALPVERPKETVEAIVEWAAGLKPGG